MMRRPRRMCSPVNVFFLYAALALFGASGAVRGSVPVYSADSIGMPDSVGFRLARIFLDERGGNCDVVPGAIVPSRGKKKCLHPLDNYVFYRNDSLVILKGGKNTLAAYARFGSVRSNGRRTDFSFREFLPYTELPGPAEDPWAVRQFKKLLNWTLGNLLRFMAPHLAELWANMSGVWKTTAVVIGSVLALLFIVLLARALARSRAIQNRLSGPQLTAVTAVRKTDWMAEAESRLRAGDSRGALSALYCWFISWVTERGFIRRQEWWTNRQLVAALRRSRPAVTGLAQSLISAYEETEYGHRPVDGAAVGELNSRARAERWGAR